MNKFAFFLMLCLMVLSFPEAQADEYELFIHVAKPAGEEKRVRCTTKDSVCTFTLDVTGHAPLEVKAMPDDSGIFLSFVQSGYHLPVSIADGRSRAALGVPREAFMAVNPVENRLVLMAPDAFTEPIYPYPGQDRLLQHPVIIGRGSTRLEVDTVIQMGGVH